jgi:hypothetical protein
MLNPRMNANGSQRSLSSYAAELTGTYASPSERPDRPLGYRERHAAHVQPGLHPHRTRPGPDQILDVTPCHPLEPW